MVTPDVTDVRALRERLGMNQLEFARLLGVDVRSIRRWEQGMEPTATARAIMFGFQQALDDTDKVRAEKSRAIIVRATRLGGLPFLLFDLLQRASQ